MTTTPHQLLAVSLLEKEESVGGRASKCR